MTLLQPNMPHQDSPSNPEKGKQQLSNIIIIDDKEEFLRNIRYLLELKQPDLKIITINEDELPEKIQESTEEITSRNTIIIADKGVMLGVTKHYL